eukprot:TRINITY_DN983_c0_g1_i3.p1 TRINITY_DN983_c0_g1~~TRINITY_DN983_c0_g1_i3.p1  ORF type:complete len:371 (-),score=115.53 TRINITY_DN983_c0_g1_i3:215-1327(-)
MRAISEAGFEHPSEVQQECLPEAIQGHDIICQAKSGMGKTAVFVISILQQLPGEPAPFTAIVLAPTRELAFQIHKDFMRLGKYIKGFSADVFYGGEKIEIQEKRIKAKPPVIVVGTPGRILDLAERKLMTIGRLKFFVVDECDQLLANTDMRGQFWDVFKKTPTEKQVMMFSATYTKEAKQICSKYLRKPKEVFINDDSQLTLEGITQFYLKVVENEKNKRLADDILDKIEFNQVMIFVKTVPRAKALSEVLNKLGFPSIEIHSDLTQEERIERYRLFKTFQKRIMVSTNILSRGIDVEKVNLVVNYDMPDSTDTYLHRVGRAGRFGTKGVGITFVCNEEDSALLEEIQKRFVVKITEMPEQIDESLYKN